MKVEVFSPKFKKRLAEDGFPVSEIEEESANGTIRHAYRTAHRWLDGSYTPMLLREILYNRHRDGVLPRIVAGVNDILIPWKKTNCTEFLPVITFKELGRQIGMDPKYIFGLLRKWHPEFNIGEQTFGISTTEVSSIPLGECNRKRWQRQCTKQDAEYLNVKMAFITRKPDFDTREMNSRG